MSKHFPFGGGEVVSPFDQLLLLEKRVVENTVTTPSHQHIPDAVHVGGKLVNERQFARVPLSARAIALNNLELMLV